MPLFLILVAVPIIEIALFIQVGGWIGLWPTLGIVILTAFVGTVMLRSQGLAALGELQRKLQAGEDPSATLAHGAMILVSGILLLTPGFFTDTLGLLLLVPAFRSAAIRYASNRMVIHTRVHMQGRAQPGAGGYRDPGTVEGEYEVVDGDDATADGSERKGDSAWTRVPHQK